MSQPTCGCTRPLRAGYALCDTCRKTLEQHLAEMAWLDDQLDISLTRSKGVDYRRSSPGRSADKPLPWNERAAIARSNLKNELVGWVRTLEKGNWPKDTLPSIAAWLLMRLEVIAKRDDAWTMFIEITGASEEARAVVFAKPEPKVFLAPCEGQVIDKDGEIFEVPCEGEIWGNEALTKAECDACLRAYEPTAAMRRRNTLLADRLLTIVEIADLAHRTFGQPRDKVINTAKAWQKRGQIVAHAHADELDEDGVRRTVARFRYEDVLERLEHAYGDVS